MTKRQIAQLERAFHRGATESSAALERWLNAPTAISIDSVVWTDSTTTGGTAGDSVVPTVTWTVKDSSGNSITCVQTVIVTDTQLPTIACRSIKRSGLPKPSQVVSCLPTQRDSSIAI